MKNEIRAITWDIHIKIDADNYDRVSDGLVLRVPAHEISLDLKTAFPNERFRQLAYEALFEVSKLEALYNLTR